MASNRDDVFALIFVTMLLVGIAFCAGALVGAVYHCPPCGVEVDRCPTR